jgi:hypothetical protein
VAGCPGLALIAIRSHLLTLTMTNLELTDRSKVALADGLRSTIATLASLVLVFATAVAGPPETASAPITSRPSNAAVSPNLSDVPTAHRSGGENPRVVPRPKPLPPRRAELKQTQSGRSFFVGQSRDIPQILLKSLEFASRSRYSCAALVCLHGGSHYGPTK